MGYGTRAGGYGLAIRTFSPDDTHNTIYIAQDEFLKDIWKKARKKWPGIQMSELTIAAEHIQTDFLGYNQYYSSDYTNFLCITANESYFRRKKKKK